MNRHGKSAIKRKEIRYMDKKPLINREQFEFIQFLKDMLLILAIPLFILIIVYYGLMKNIVQQTFEQNLGIIQSSAQNIERTFDNIDNISVYFSDNRNITGFYYKANPLKEGKTTSSILQAQQDLAAMGIANSDILNIQMYASDSDALIDYAVCSLYPERYYGKKFQLKNITYEQWRKDYLEIESAVFYQQAVMTFQGSTNEVLIYNRNFISSNWNKKKDRIIFFISKDKLLRFFDVIDYKEEGFICILDEKGEELLFQNNMNVDPGFLEDSIFTGNRGYTSQNIDNKKMFLTYYRSEERNWLYIAAVPYASVTAVIMPLRASMLFLLMLACVTGVLLVMQIAWKLYRPIKEVGNILGGQVRKIPLEDFAHELMLIVKGKEELKEEMQQQMDVINAEAFKNVILGNITAPDSIREYTGRIGVDQSASWYVIMILVWNDLDIDIGLEEIGAQKVYMESIIHRQKDVEVQEIYQLDLERTIILMAYGNISRKEVRAKAEDFIQRILDEALQNIHYSISVGGDIADDILYLSKCFLHAKKSLTVSQNIFGSHNIQWYEIAKRYLLSAPQESEEEFIAMRNARLIEAVQEYISLNYMDSGLSLTSIADVFSITEVYLSKLFKRITEQNFSKYIEGERMVHAIKYLEEGIKIVEVSEKVGYNSPQVFRRAWKRYYGGIPSEKMAVEETDE